MMNMNPKALDALMRLASQKLGTTPDELRKQFQNGNFERALGDMPPSEAQKLQSALANPKLAEKILSTPQAKEIFDKLSK